LSIGDRVRLAGVLHTVIAVSGTVVRLADIAGQVADIGLPELLVAEDFEVVSGSPRPPVPPATPLDGLPEAVAAQALWWERHIVEVLRGVPPQAPVGTRPRPEYDPELVSLTRREQAKAAELTAAGMPVTASAIAKRRRRYEALGVVGMVDHRIDKPVTPHGRVDPLVVEAMRQAIAEATQESSRTASFLFWRTSQILDAAHGPGVVQLPSQRSLYRLLEKLSAGKHTTGSARTRRSLADRPDGPFGQTDAWAPGELMQIDSTPLDVLVRLDDGVTGRVDLTGMIDVATRTVTAAILRPTTKSVDASVLLARTVTPEPMRPGWAQALAMSRSALPFGRLLDIDARLEHAAARPVIIPETIVVDQGKVFISANFRASCNFLGINFQPVHDASGWEKGHIERMLGSVGTLFAQFVSGYTGFNAERRGRHVEQQAVWSLLELQDLLDEWIVRVFTDRRNSDTGSELRLCIDYMSATTTRSCLPSLVWVVRVWHGFCLVRRPGLRAAMVHPFDLGESGQDDRNDLLRFARSNARYARLGRAIPLKVVTLVPVDVIRACSSLIAVLQPCHGWTPSPRSRRLRRSVRLRATG
jgi:hypothetical protein